MPIIITNQKPRFFAAPHKGRQILAGFSYLQRMRKNASTRVWIPKNIHSQTVEWAAIREFDLLQEGDNLVIDDLNIFDMPRTLRALRAMQGGGYRVVMITLGRYSDGTAPDDLEILDKKLQDEITKMIHFLYLDELSKATSLFKHAALEKPTWNCAEALPHIAQSLAEKKLFYPHKIAAEESLFLDLLEHLPCSHIMHDAAIGLSLPEAEKNKNWTYIAKGECQAMAFFNAIGDVLDETITHHMRSGATHIRPEARRGQQRAAIALAS